MALSEAGREILLAMDAIKSHSETHGCCDACIANVETLFNALGYWVTGDNINRAKLEEVFGEKKAIDKKVDEWVDKAEAAQDQVHQGAAQGAREGAQGVETDGKTQDAAVESWEDAWK